MSTTKQATDRLARRRTLAGLLFVLVCMVGLCLAAVPLYRLFCSATGFGGTVRIAEAAPAAQGARVVTVRFNADVAEGLPWEFAPDQIAVETRTGIPTLAKFHAVNRSNHTIVGRAIYNVTPDKAGPYFDKIQCFCFSNEVLKPGERAELPVTFFVDPEISKDPNLADVTTITLSYTFFEAK